MAPRLAPSPENRLRRPLAIGALFAALLPIAGGRADVRRFERRPATPPAHRAAKGDGRP